MSRFSAFLLTAAFVVVAGIFAIIDDIVADRTEKSTIEAVIYREDGTTIEGTVDCWKRFYGMDIIQIKIGNTTYFTHSSNVLLISR